MSLHIPELSDKYQTTYAVAEKPRGLRAAWAVLRGKYEPKVTLNHSLTTAGADKLLKEAYLPGIKEALSQPSTFLEDFGDQPPTE